MWFRNELSSLAEVSLYTPFSEVIEHKKRKIVLNSLKYSEGTLHYGIDFELLEKQFQDETNKILLFCSPQNTVGRVWTKDELHKIHCLAKNYNIIILSDEIWQDIEYDPFNFISMLQMDQDDDISIVFSKIIFLSRHVIFGGLF